MLLDEIDGKTEITLTHSSLPESGEHYKQGWEDHYFAPMRKHFQRKAFTSNTHITVIRSARINYASPHSNNLLKTQYFQYTIQAFPVL